MCDLVLVAKAAAEAMWGGAPVGNATTTVRMGQPEAGSLAAPAIRETRTAAVGRFAAAPALADGIVDGGFGGRTAGAGRIEIIGFAGKGPVGAAKEGLHQSHGHLLRFCRKGNPDQDRTRRPRPGNPIVAD